MLEVTTQLKQNLQVETRAAGVAVRMDESRAQGGDGAGLAPQEMLLAALTGCTAMTLRLYARKKQWPLEGVTIRGTLDRAAPGAADPATRLVQHVTLEGPLDAEQRKRLMEIAGKCPVHKILEGPIALEEHPA
jgi:putative redox protein